MDVKVRNEVERKLERTGALRVPCYLEHQWGCRVAMARLEILSLQYLEAASSETSMG